MDAYLYQYGVGLVFFLAGLAVAAKHGYVGLSGRGLKNLVLICGVTAAGCGSSSGSDHGFFAHPGLFVLHQGLPSGVVGHDYDVELATSSPAGSSKLSWRSPLLCAKAICAVMMVSSAAGMTK